MEQQTKAPAPMNEIDALLRGRLAAPVADVAKWLGVGRSTLYDAIGRKKVPTVEGIGAVRIPAWWVRKQLAPPE